MRFLALLPVLVVALAIVTGLVCALPYFFPPICAGLGGGCGSP